MFLVFIFRYFLFFMLMHTTHGHIYTKPASVCILAITVHFSYNVAKEKKKLDNSKYFQHPFFFTSLFKRMLTF